MVTVTGFGSGSLDVGGEGGFFILFPILRKCSFSSEGFIVQSPLFSHQFRLISVIKLYNRMYISSRHFSYSSICTVHFQIT